MICVFALATCRSFFRRTILSEGQICFGGVGRFELEKILQEHSGALALMEILSRVFQTKLTHVEICEWREYKIRMFMWQVMTVYAY